MVSAHTAKAYGQAAIQVLKMLRFDCAAELEV